MFDGWDWWGLECGSFAVGVGTFEFQGLSFLLFRRGAHIGCEFFRKQVLDIQREVLQLIDFLYLRLLFPGKQALRSRILVTGVGTLTLVLADVHRSNTRPIIDIRRLRRHHQRMLILLLINPHRLRQRTSIPHLISILLPNKRISARFSRKRRQLPTIPRLFGAKSERLICFLLHGVVKTRAAGFVEGRGKFAFWG